MKIGPFCGFSLEEIVVIKTKEENLIGKFFLGYSGVFCHPKRVKEFIQLAQSEHEKVRVLFIKTTSNFVSPIKKLSHYSLNSKDWQSLPEEVLLVGSKFSLVAKGLKSVNFEIDLSHYQSCLGVVPGKTLDNYLKFRCDKSCAVHSPKLRAGKSVKIDYMCDLVDEGCVYVK